MTRTERIDEISLIDRGATANSKAAGALVQAGIPASIAEIVSRSEKPCSKFLMEGNNGDTELKNTQQSELIRAHLLQNPQDAEELFDAIESERQQAEESAEHLNTLMQEIASNYRLERVKIAVGRLALVG